ncbi:GNAT family N-acetyltransferase [Nitrogeniibacter mangrovi]|uniref:GNAT family N-acetyltransferase n=1 Tax=Nitrogeniibacter mangrovi TaxID=2016596 RepID=A0A6C1B3J6_9RHOO|nr:GNAT family N-acetyltransferase [Nitrogeniibacter mangrovi]QID17425.1 GNAT family N-acetyltransferase [Nitrogeniibacter mangrovi]
MSDVLDNPTWHTLAGTHAAFAQGTDRARRYAPGFSPILGFADNAAPDLAALLPHCASGEHFYTAGWEGLVPAGWVLDDESTMFRMVWDGELPPEAGADRPVPLGPQHADQAMALATRMASGPFGPRTLELGHYLGVFDGDRLVAMAGERLRAGPYCEISAVCTDPDYQGRGLARHLMLALVRRQLAHGETPFIHVMSANTAAHRLYLRVGFHDFSQPVVRVISRL